MRSIPGYSQPFEQTEAKNCNQAILETTAYYSGLLAGPRADLPLVDEMNNCVSPAVVIHPSTSPMLQAIITLSKESASVKMRQALQSAYQHSWDNGALSRIDPHRPARLLTPEAVDRMKAANFYFASYAPSKGDVDNSFTLYHFFLLFHGVTETKVPEDGLNPEKAGTYISAIMWFFASLLSTAEEQAASIFLDNLHQMCMAFRQPTFIQAFPQCNPQLFAYRVVTHISQLADILLAWKNMAPDTKRLFAGPTTHIGAHPRNLMDRVTTWRNVCQQQFNPANLCTARVRNK